MLMLTLLFSALSPCALADSEELSPPELQSAAAIVIDMDTGRSLYDYNADEQRPGFVDKNHDGSAGR